MLETEQEIPEHDSVTQINMFEDELPEENFGQSSTPDEFAVTEEVSKTPVSIANTDKPAPLQDTVPELPEKEVTAAAPKKTSAADSPLVTSSKTAHQSYRPVVVTPAVDQGVAVKKASYFNARSQSYYADTHSSILMFAPVRREPSLQEVAFRFQAETTLIAMFTPYLPPIVALVMMWNTLATLHNGLVDIMQSKTATWAEKASADLYRQQTLGLARNMLLDPLVKAANESAEYVVQPAQRSLLMAH